MAKSEKAVITLPAFPMSAITRAVAQGMDGVIDAMNVVGEQQAGIASAVHGAFMKYTDSLIVSGNVPANESGKRLIRAGIMEKYDQAMNEDDEFASAVHSGMIGDCLKRETVSQYATGVMLAYFAKVAWHPRAANSEDDGGIVRPDWWKAAQAARSESVKAARAAKATKPGKVTKVTTDDLNKTLTVALSAIRTLHGDKVADATVDALTSTVPGFKVTV